MFLGDYNHNVDDKGRMFLPAKFRNDLGKTIVITKGFDNCLYVFPKQTWNEFAQGLAKMIDSDSKVRKIQRLFCGRAVECDVDKQGRIVVPPKLRELANIKNSVTIVGMMNKIEIWDTEAFEATMLDNDEAQELLEQYEFSGSSYGI